MLILGIETSCDETGAALYDTKAGLLGDVLHSQVMLHAAYGGVVPELASRDHVRRLLPLLRSLLEGAGRRIDDVGLIAFTQGPGLGGALLVGASVAAGIGLALGRPVAGIHHLEGHLLSPLLADPRPAFPFVALLVSGGHTQLMRVDGVGRYALLGETLDDAAGEAFDKTATVLGLAYPGGPALAQLAESGDPERFHFPRPMMAADGLDFSFSGLKTAVLTRVREIGAPDERTRADLAASFQAAVVDVLAAKCAQALEREGLDRLVVAGGVGANARLRERLTERVRERGGEVFFPPARLCTDNGAMIAFAAALRHAEGLDRPLDGFPIHPRWDLASAARGGQSTPCR
ncbi:MAG TPA: tRNA (adenosine(37)-N6)-threonylcarbamoyltransferase complex transferase subunit TsaD [Usitatibacter sp.]|nr:tRNA (adenosine(37)-N6)-threonylcarbamoyltransferase complex transferase subunit TsaD [Usitatibacter sp.]